MPQIKLITFDVTGTLLLFRVPVFEKYVQTGLKYGINADPGTVEKNFKTAWKALNEKYPNYGKNTDLSWQDWWNRIVDRTFSSFTTPEEYSKIQMIFKELHLYHTTKEAFTIRPGTEDLLRYLKTKQLKLGVVSNYDPRLNDTLDVTGLKKYMDFVLVSYEFGWAKPDSRIFEEALRLGNCQSAQESIHIGDNLELDYLAAKNAGMNAFLLHSEPETIQNPEVQKDEVFEDFFKLTNHLKTYLS